MFKQKGSLVRGCGFRLLQRAERRLTAARLGGVHRLRGTYPDQQGRHIDRLRFLDDQRAGVEVAGEAEGECWSLRRGTQDVRPVADGNRGIDPLSCESNGYDALRGGADCGALAARVQPVLTGVCVGSRIELIDTLEARPEASSTLAW